MVVTALSFCFPSLFKYLKFTENYSEYLLMHTSVFLATLLFQITCLAKTNLSKYNFSPTLPF
jgi:hypothetical protein